MPVSSSLPRHVHFIGICGRAMGSLAIELRKHGVRVTGSDQQVFPPMDNVLRRAGIVFHQGFDAAHLNPLPDCVIIGSYFTPVNPEVAAVLERRIPWFNLPAFLNRYLLQHGNNLVVAGTNGKTTTTAMLAAIMRHAGKKPDYLVAGQARNLPQMMRLQKSRWCVLEGDEYISGLGDLNPKFLHYRPQHVLVTNVHWDHVEVFKCEEHYKAGFEALIDLLPVSGSLVLDADDAGSMALKSRRKQGQTLTVGFDRKSDHWITALRQNRNGSRFRLLDETFFLPAHGKINVKNAAMAAVMAAQCGVKPAKIAEALAGWQGVAGRQEVIWQSPRLIIINEDGYHPHALRGAIEAVRTRFPGKHLTVLLQPRYTGGGDGNQQHELPDVLGEADDVIVTSPVEIAKFEKSFSPQRLCAALRRRKCRARHVPSLKDCLPILAEEIRPSQVLLISIAYRNESFFEALGQRLKAAS